MRSATPAALLASLTLLAATGEPVLAQGAQSGGSHTEGVDTTRTAGIVAVPDFSDPAVKAEIRRNAELRERERELKKIRFKHFGSIRATAIRQIGLGLLRPYAEDPDNWPLLMDVFQGEGADVRTGLLGLFDEHEGAEADGAFAWFGVHAEDEDFRKEAADRLVERSERLGRVTNTAKRVLADGLKSPNDTVAGSAAGIAAALSLYEAIPAMISAVIVETPNGPEQRAIAQIYVATQQAFVSDLTPVVSDGAVGFDPELSVVTDGVVLHVLDAVVVTYRTQVFGPLAQLASEGWGGRPTEQFGYDQAKWREWYAKEFKPYREGLAEGAEASDTEAPAPAPMNADDAPAAPAGEPQPAP